MWPCRPITYSGMPPTSYCRNSRAKKQANALTPAQQSSLALPIQFTIYINRERELSILYCRRKRCIPNLHTLLTATAKLVSIFAATPQRYPAAPLPRLTPPDAGETKQKRNTGNLRCSYATNTMRRGGPHSTAPRMLPPKTCFTITHRTVDPTNV